MLAMAVGVCARDDNSGPEFTPRAQQAMALARRIAMHRQKTVIESDDLLAGICVLRAGLAFDALSQCRIPPSAILADLGASDEWIQPTPQNNLPYDDSLKILLALAVRESKGTKSDYTGTDHMLIAMFDPRVKKARDYFKGRGVTLREIEIKLSEIRQKSDRQAEALPSTIHQ